MSIRLTATLHCNACSAMYPSGQLRKSVELRRAAAGAGWTYSRGLDHCPGCAARKPAPARRGRGVCAVCDTVRLLSTATGDVIAHEQPRGVDNLWVGWCPGGRQAPARVTDPGREYRPAPKEAR